MRGSYQKGGGGRDTLLQEGVGTVSPEGGLCHLRGRGEKEGEFVT